jgi:hypothetical protein
MASISSSLRSSIDVVADAGRPESHTAAREFSSLATGSGLGEPSTLASLPTETIQGVLEEAHPQDVNRFSQTSPQSLAVVQGDPALRPKLESARTANVTVDRLQRTGEYNPANPEPTQRVFSQLGPHLGYIDETQSNALVGAAVGKVDEGERATAIGAAAPHWGQFSTSQQDTLLRGATTINNSQQRGKALRLIGWHSLQRLTPAQQRDWATSVAALPPSERLTTISQSNVPALSDDQKGLLRTSISPLPDSQRKDLALRLLE